MKTINIENRLVEPNQLPYIIAEISGNHNGDISHAFQLLEAAKIAGVDAVKLQTYTAETITIDYNSDDFKIDRGLWVGKTLYYLYNEAHPPWASKSSSTWASACIRLCM